VSQLIEMLSFAHHVEEGAILMILKPLEIEGRKIKGFRPAEDAVQIVS